MPYIHRRKLIFFLFLNSSVFQKTYLKSVNQTGSKGGEYLRFLSLPKPKEEEKLYLKRRISSTQNKQLRQSERETSIKEIDCFFELYFSLTKPEIDALN